MLHHRMSRLFWGVTSVLALQAVMMSSNVIQLVANINKSQRSQGWVCQIQVVISLNEPPRYLCSSPSPPRVISGLRSKGIHG